jgi:hypothetical protein
MNPAARMASIVLLSSGLGPLALHAPAQPPQLVNYQGRLIQGTNLVNGNVALSLRVFHEPAGGTLLYEDSNTVAVSDGLYATILGDQTNSGSLAAALAATNAYIEVMIDGVALAPREHIASVFYALRAEDANSLDGYDASAFAGAGHAHHGADITSGTVAEPRIDAMLARDSEIVPAVLAGDGTGSTLDADLLDGYDAGAFAGASHAHNAADIASGTLDDARLSTNVSLLGSSVQGAEIQDGTVSALDINAASFSNTFWKTDGNAGTVTGTHFLGTTDAQPLELRVDGLRALRLEPAGSTPHVIGGSSANTVATGTLGVIIGGGQSNAVGHSADVAVIAGGRANSVGVNADESFIGGGSGNRIESGANGSTSAGGGDNTVGPLSFYSAIGGGNGNDIATNCWYAAIPGGFNNSVDSNAQYATVAGGSGNKAAGSYAFAAGRSARALHEGTFVWADSSASAFASTASNQMLIRARGGVGINTNAPQQALHVSGNVQAERFYFSSNAWLQLDASGTSLLFVANSVTNELN